MHKIIIIKLFPALTVYKEVIGMTKLAERRGYRMRQKGDFPGSPVAKTPQSQGRGHGFHP